MFIVDEIEYERLEPICCRCGRPLTSEEYEIYQECCEFCCNEIMQ